MNNFVLCESRSSSLIYSDLKDCHLAICQPSSFASRRRCRQGRLLELSRNQHLDDPPLLWLGPWVLRVGWTGRALSDRIHSLGNHAAVVETLAAALPLRSPRMAMAQPRAMGIAKHEDRKIIHRLHFCYCDLFSLALYESHKE